MNVPVEHLHYFRREVCSPVIRRRASAKREEDMSQTSRCWTRNSRRAATSCPPTSCCFKSSFVAQGCLGLSVRSIDKGRKASSLPGGTGAGAHTARPVKCEINVYAGAEANGSNSRAVSTRMVRLGACGGAFGEAHCSTVPLLYPPIAFRN